MSASCERCGAGVTDPDEDLCGAGYCRRCHVSLSFEECCDGSWSDSLRARTLGIPVEELADHAGPSRVARKARR